MTEQQYTVTISDGTNSVGIQTSSRTNIRRLPRGAGVERKAQRQITWNGGRGADRFASDATKFYDSKSLWSMVDGWALPGPLLCLGQYGNLINGLKPAGVLAWCQSPAFGNRSTTFAIGDGNLIARSFTPTANFTAANLTLWIRQAANAVYTVAIYNDYEGHPGSALWSTTVTATYEESTKNAQMKAWNPNLALTSGTPYWVVVSASDEVLWGVDTSTSGKRYTNATWSTVAYAPLFYLTDGANAPSTLHFFEYQRLLYMATQPASGASQLYRNGDRGIATGIQSTTTLKDTTKTWTVNEWAGCVCAILSGANEFEYRPIASNTADTLTLAAADAWPTAPVAGSGGSVYVILGSDKWTEITGHGFTGAVTSVAALNGLIYFAQGDLIDMRRMREYDNAGVWTREFAADSSNKARIILNAEHWDDGAQALYRVNGANQVSVAKKVGWGTALTFETAIECGNTEGPVRSLSDYDNDVYAVKDDGVWALRAGKFGKIPFGMEAARDERNGVAATGWNQQFYFSLMDGLERLYGNVVDDIGPNRGESMPYNRRGAITGVRAVVQYLLAAYDAKAYDSSLLATTSPGGDWHELTRGQTGKRIKALYYQTVPGKANRLWLMYGPLIGYLVMPDDIHNPVNDTNMRYAPEGQLITTWFDFETPELDHLFRQIRLTTVNANTWYPVRVEYEEWPNSRSAVNWRDMRWADGGSIASSAAIVAMTIGSGNVTGKKIRFRITLPSDTVTPVALRSFELRGDTMNEVLYDFIFDIREDDRLMLLDGGDTTQSAADALAILEGWRETAIPLTLTFAGDHTDIFTGVSGHIDPVSLVTGEWNEEALKVSGNIVFKQTE